MKAVLSFICRTSQLLRKVVHKFFVMPCEKACLASCGENVTIGRNAEITYSNVHIGDNVSLNEGVRILSTRASVFIGNNVMFGPQVFIVTGDHRIDILDKPMMGVTDEEKLPENDQDVVFEGDNWVGARAVILKGVRVGAGSVIAAGSVVTHDVPSLSIVGGCPAKVIGLRTCKKGNKSDLVDVI